jgi:hypothetical protein
MDPELRQELATIHALAKDNHDMLRAIRRAQWYSFWIKVIFWTVAIVIPFLVYQHYLEPLVSNFAPSGTTETTKSSFGLPSTADIEKLINLYTGADIGQ